ncbi:MAG: hypothetical protein A2096_17265 [Spirochaetes bacterium GWF1_41_5]|nr:MAG: hypothetical protein A2096_17265 [Spirochaetes bacterium GWF1_41_5]HBE03137.1 glycoside hydrolase [Spirochaetia bacterium]
MSRCEIRGAIYIPSRAYNAPQMWKNYSASETARDIGYAKSVNLNAFRVWLSWEYWLRHPDHFTDSFEDFLDQCSSAGIGVMPSLFENCGVPPTEENIWSTDPTRAFAINSPHKKEIIADQTRWKEPAEFIKWFMRHYRNDRRLLAIETHNEPCRPNNTMEFARAMFRVAADNRGKRPLTIGSCDLIDNMYFIEYGLDVLQFHHNFPKDHADLMKSPKGIEIALQSSRILEKPVWITELQRLRPTDPGWGNIELPQTELEPDLASVMPIVHETGIGFFFWSLMLKPAYLPNQRGKGTINGLFQENGSVWSIADARSVADDQTLLFYENRTWPVTAPAKLWRNITSEGSIGG